METKGRLLGGVLLVSGTAIGAAMLALPVSTGIAGFFPSFALIVLVWILMTFTALLMLEVNLWMPADSNLVSMAKLTLGRKGEMFSWIAYLFLLYALTTAYIAGCAPIFTSIIEFFTGTQQLPAWTGSIPLLLIFGFFIYKGTRSVDIVNRVLMIGLIAAYVLLVIFAVPHVEGKLLLQHNSYFLTLASSVIITSFGFHIVIPTLSTYMKRDVKLIKKAILIGSTIPLFVYILWEMVTLGVVPQEKIKEAFLTGGNGADLLAEILNNPTISAIAHCLLFFAIVTSFLGVSLSLSDFLADGLKIRKTRKGRLLLCLISFIPPLLISLSYPRIFLTALEYAGAYGVVSLLCILPALMAWRGRYVKKIASHYEAPGGKPALVLVMIASVIVVLLELGSKLGWFEQASF